MALSTSASVEAEGIESQPATNHLWKVIAGVLAVVLVVTLGGAVVVVMRGTAQSDALTLLLADQTVTKTYKELERQAKRPPAQRSTGALQWAIATPQSDKSGLVWTTAVLSSDLSRDVLSAHVSTSLADAEGAPSQYLEFIVQVTPAPNGQVNSAVMSCVVRSGASNDPLATSPVWITDHMFLDPCPREVLQQVGVAS